jgi:ABC-type dipeptide/oligopeptide/nickel transport system ATPase component/ABC-type dipeptide/oligopeptide/nickel transport system permease subunit
VTELPPTSALPDLAVERRGLVRRLARNPLGIASIAVLVIAFLASVCAPLLTTWDPNITEISNTLAAPGDGHLLGTDSAGRDVLARLLYGGRLTFAASALATGVALLGGVPAGLIAGYYGGWFDAAAGWVSNMLLSLPGIVVLLAVRAALGPSIWYSMVVFGLLLTPAFFRLVRTSVRSVRNDLYVDAARVAGLGDGRIIGRHILYVVRAPLIIQAAIVAGIAIAVQAGLEFLNLGDPGTPSWGAMLNEGFRNVYISPTFLIWPALAISLVTASLALLGNALRDALEDGDQPARKGGARAAGTPLVSSWPGETVPAPVEHPGPTIDPVLTVENLTISYPQPDGSDRVVVNDVSFEVGRGEIVGLVGESGSGKTQTAFSILGLLPDTAHVAAGASIRLDGTQLLAADGRSLLTTKLPQLRGKRIAYIPQEPMSNLDPNFTIGYQLQRPLRKVFGFSKADAERRAIELLTLVGIRDPRHTMASYPHQISGGMAQRVLIAGAVAGEPDVLVADEPTTALDVTVQAEVLDLLRDLQQRTGMSVLIVTHNFGVVADLCDRVVVMQSSRLVESGSVRDVLGAPGHPYTRGLLAATLEGKTPRTKLGRPGSVT